MIARKTPPASPAEAGRRGADVRSDLWVRIEPRAKGGVRIVMTSKVDRLYGDSIRAVARRTLSRLGVTNAHITIEDQGALPFVIAARVEAAARRAGFSTGDARPPRVIAAAPPSARDRMRRSRLYLPGNEPKFMINAGLHRPDAIILDLEDSVHPAEKDAARLLVRNALRCVDFLGAERMVRINQLPLGLADLEAVVPEQPDLILIPKTERPEQVAEVAARVRRVAGADRPVWLMPILESAQGVERAFEIAAADPWVVALTIGLEDYTADMGVPRTREGAESLFARTRIVNAARAAGLQAIDSVWSDIADVEGLKAWGARSRALGFEGMGCIHPRQVGPIHQAFAPSGDEIDRALRIVDAFREAEAAGRSVVALGSKMIDPPVVLRASRLVANAQRQGLIGGKDAANDSQDE
jgi:citrate lyase subunit beta/citryl-CoA lyase